MAGDTIEMSLTFQVATPNGSCLRELYDFMNHMYLVLIYIIILEMNVY